MSRRRSSAKELGQLAPCLRLSRQEVRRLGQLCTTIACVSGTVLAHEDHLCREFVLLVEGTARMIGDGDLIGVLEAGQHFGELAIVRGVRNPLTIVACTSVTLEVMNTREFLSAYQTMPALRTHIDDVIEQQLAGWSERTPYPPDPDGPDLGAPDQNPYTLAS